jgi:peptidoglycan hydrolase-like protein with peptidoglycan-binding domain
MLCKNGSTSYEVKIIQNNLKVLGFYPGYIDGVFGSETEASVKNFQESYDLSIDGIVGDITYSKLTNEIKKIQGALNNNGYNLVVDGIAGINTYNALIDFQQLKHLTVDGIVNGIIDEDTRSNLFSAEILYASHKFNISDSGINFIANYETYRSYYR